MSPWWLHPPAEETAEGSTTDNDTLQVPADGKPGDKPRVDSKPARGAAKASNEADRQARDSSPAALRHSDAVGRQTRQADSSSSRSAPIEPRSTEDERRIALYCDLESMVLGARAANLGRFDLGLILERLLEKGRIIVKRAYAEWERYDDYKRALHEAGMELIDVPTRQRSGTGRAGVKLAVDALESCFSRQYLDTFVILSGEGELSPLISKLRESNRMVLGIGFKPSAAKTLVDNCDEFLYYEDLRRQAASAPRMDGIDDGKAEAFALMVAAIQALMRENKEILWGSMIKQTMQRKRPSFNEGQYGYSAFSELLEDAERHQIVELQRDQRSGSYVVTGFGRR